MVGKRSPNLSLFSVEGAPQKEADPRWRQAAFQLVVTICAAAVTQRLRNHAGRSLAPHLLPREEGPQAEEAGTEPQQVRRCEER